MGIQSSVWPPGVVVVSITLRRPSRSWNHFTISGLSCGSGPLLGAGLVPFGLGFRIMFFSPFYSKVRSPFPFWIGGRLAAVTGSGEQRRCREEPATKLQNHSRTPTADANL